MATTPSPIRAQPHHGIPLLAEGAAVEVCAFTLVVWWLTLVVGAAAFSVRVLVTVVPGADWVTVVVRSVVVVDAEALFELVTLATRAAAAEVAVPTFACPLALEAACPTVPDPQPTTTPATNSPTTKAALI
jgi:hypothetical protein